MESNKFGRQYFISVVELSTGKSITKTIGLPFTCKFALNRTWGKMAGNGTIQIYNLNKDTRSFLRKDSTSLGATHWVSISAGYGTEVSTLMEGGLQVGSSVRNGVDYITTLQIADLTDAYRNATFSQAFKQGTSVGTIIKTIAKGLEEYGIKLGVVSRTITGKSKRGTSLSGKAIDILDEMVGGQYFVDNGVLNVVSDDEYLDGFTLLVNSRYGLLGKPRREGQNIVISLILEPRAYVGQKAIIKIENDDDDYNGTYFIRSITHTGTISETVGESATTELYLTPNKFGKKAQ